MRYITTLAVVLVVASGCLLFIYDKNGGSMDLSSTDVKIVVSGSMAGEPRIQYNIQTIPVESMVFIRKVPPGDDAQSFYSSLKVGDVLTFDYRHPVSKENMVVTHRIISISESEGVYTYTCKGDSIADDPTNGSVQVVTSASGDVIGKVVGVSHALGQAVVFLSTGSGKVCLIVIPCIILIISEIGNIVHILKKGDEKEFGVQVGSEEPVPAEVEFTNIITGQDRSDDDLYFRRS